MTLLFGNRPFDFTDFFEMVLSGEIDFSKLNYTEVMMKSVEAGFKHIEITGDLPLLLPGVLTPEEIEQLVEIKEKEKLSFSVHLPLWSMEPASFSKHIREGSVKAFIDCIELTKPLDPICWVLHPTGALTVEFLHWEVPEIAKGIMIQQFCNYAKESIQLLLEKTEISSRKIAVENIEFPFEAMEPIIEELDLSICFDTGHLLAGYSGNLSVLEFVEKYYNRLIEFHLHDGEAPAIDHKPLGTHKLPTKELLKKLTAKKFQGPLVFELTLQEAIDSMAYIEKMKNKG